MTACAVRLLYLLTMRLLDWLVLLGRLRRREGGGDPRAAPRGRGAAPASRPAQGGLADRAVFAALARLLPRVLRGHRLVTRARCSPGTVDWSLAIRGTRTSPADHQCRGRSGGFRQRLAIAQALLGSPQLLILDEPTAGLDTEQRLRFRELLSNLPSDPVIVLSTHQADDIAAICPRVVVMLDGRIPFAGTPTALADTAAGHVWTADQRDDRAHLSWRDGDNRWRHIGNHPPEGSERVTPTVEDGYLLLSHAAQK